MWVARDKKGDLFLYKTEPQRAIGIWEPCDGSFMDIDKELFPDLTWESEPQEVCLCINDEKYHTVKVSTLDAVYQRLNNLESEISKFNSLPLYKRLLYVLLGRNK